MAAGFKVWHLLENDFLAHNPHIAGAAITAGIFITGGVIYRATTKQKALLSSKNIQSVSEEDLVPSDKASSRNVVEFLGEFVRDKLKDIIGEDYPKFLPLLSFVFMWVLANNLIGIIPGFASATADINTTLSMGIFIFLYYNFMGFYSHGFKYLEHFTGHLHGVLLIALGWLMFPIELISHAVRPVTLGVRLRTNIYADHSVYENISGQAIGLTGTLSEKMGVVGAAIGHIFSALAPVPIVLLGVLVCVIQALVFTLLSSVYISIATAHEEH
jgi:F-type H+-transporting ATPase subunit a